MFRYKEEDQSSILDNLVLYENVKDYFVVT